MNPHLTDEQLQSLLAAPATAVEADANRAHLESCAACHEEFTSLSQSIGNFKLAATQFSAAKAPTRLLAPSARGGFFTMPRLVWAGGLAAAMALGTVSVNMLHHASSSATDATQTRSKVLEAQSDDALLRDIDQDLSTSIAPSLQPLSVSTTAEASTPSSN